MYRLTLGNTQYWASQIHAMMFQEAQQSTRYPQNVTNKTIILTGHNRTNKSRDFYKDGQQMLNEIITGLSS